MKQSEAHKPPEPLADDAANAALTAADVRARGGREPSVGDVIAGKYVVESILGRGGMGIVLAARHTQLHERVALKFLREDVGARGLLQARFLREAQVSAKLRNEHIARVMDVAVLEDGRAYMVMEFVDGSDLRSLRRAEARVSIESAVEFVVQACEGLAEAHAQGVVHRDLKPSNLLLTKRSDGSALIKILDFGISKSLPSEDGDLGELTHTGVVLGSPKYTAPEQLCASADVDARADVWSLGVCLYEFLTGQKRFPGSSFAVVCSQVLSEHPTPPIRERCPNVPDALVQAVENCLQRDRQKRTQTVADLAEQLLLAIGAPSAATRAESIRATLERRSVLPVLAPGTAAPASIRRTHATELAPDVPMTAEAEVSSGARGWSVVALRRALACALAAVAVLATMVVTRASSSPADTVSAAAAAVAHASPRPTPSAPATPSAASSASVPPVARPPRVAPAASAPPARLTARPPSLVSDLGDPWELKPAVTRSARPLTQRSAFQDRL